MAPSVWILDPSSSSALVLDLAAPCERGRGPLGLRITDEAVNRLRQGMHAYKSNVDRAGGRQSEPADNHGLDYELTLLLVADNGGWTLIKLFVVTLERSRQWWLGQAS